MSGPGFTNPQTPSFVNAYEKLSTTLETLRKKMTVKVVVAEPISENPSNPKLRIFALDEIFECIKTKNDLVTEVIGMWRSTKEIICRPCTGNSQVNQSAIVQQHQILVSWIVSTREKKTFLDNVLNELHRIIQLLLTHLHDAMASFPVWPTEDDDGNTYENIATIELKLHELKKKIVEHEDYVLHARVMMENFDKRLHHLKEKFETTRQELSKDLKAFENTLSHPFEPL